MRHLTKRLLSIATLLCGVAMMGCTTTDLGVDDTYTGSNDSGGGIINSESADVVSLWVDTYLEKYYLYNDEYATITRDVSLTYDDGFLFQTLSSMTTNVLDYKYSWVYGYNTTFSSISRIATSSITELTRSSYTTTSTSYGFTYFAASYLTINGERLLTLTPLAVYTSSPAKSAGVARGDFITKIDNEYLTLTNYYEKATQLTSPSSGDNVELTVYGWSGSRYEYEDIPLTATNVTTNPVIYSDIIDSDDGGKIGYLVYNKFNYNFDSEFIAVLAEFKEAGITDFILDLRDNTGGTSTSAFALINCIAAPTGSDEVMAYFRYNDDITSSSVTGVPYDSTKKLFYYCFSQSNVQAHLSTLKDRHIYILVNDYSASASELVINSLRGAGFEVTLIGDNTYGKNVGSHEYTKSSGGYTYYFAPIMFEVLNGEEEGGYEAGFPADYEVNEYSVIGDYGSDFEPLLQKALSLINSNSSSSLELTRSQSASYIEMSEIVGSTRDSAKPIEGLTAPSFE